MVRPYKERPVVLVTGGAGYIGSHACKALFQKGFQPVVYDNLSCGHREFVQWGPLENGDLADVVRLKEVFQAHRPSAVMHFAAFTYVGESVTDPGKYYRNNVIGSLNLLEAMKDSDVRSLVFSSTCATYGVPQTIPIPENHPQHPINPYGASKLMMERMMADFSAAHGLKYLALRYFNAAGGDPDGEVGEWHDPETHLIPLVLDTALGKRPHVSVFGTDYSTPDGTCIRDYIHVSDLADAHLLALEYLEREQKSGALNLGNGSGYSVKQVIAEAEKVTRTSIPVVLGERRDGDPPRLVGEATLARSTLGWNPKFADLTTILQHAWQYRQKMYK